MFSFIKKPRVYIIATILVLVVGTISLFNKPHEPNIVTVMAQRGNVEQIVSVTGNVKAASFVNLAFDKSGRVSHSYVQIGSPVQAGNALVAIENADLVAQLNQASASVKAAEAKLAELMAGGSPESIAVAEVELNNAMDALRDAKKTAFDTFNETITTIDDVVRNKADGFFSNPTTISPNFNLNVSSSLETTLENQRVNLATVLREKAIVSFDESADFDALLSQSKSHLYQVRIFLNNLAVAVNSLSVNSNLSQTTIDTYRSTVSTARASVDTQISNITTSEKAIRSAQATVTLEKSQLSLTKSPARPEEISAQVAAVEQAQANVANISAQLSKTVLHSPISGVVTQKNIEVGEIASINTTVISVISTDKFEIESFIPEADIAKIHVGDFANVTLDAYGRDTAFLTRVITIDPAETVIEGVSTYKITLRFEENDERVRSGMTANIDVITGNAKDVVTIPQRAIIRKGGDRIVRVKQGEIVIERSVVTGLLGSDGLIEIIQGVKEGEEIVVFIDE